MPELLWSALYEIGAIRATTIGFNTPSTTKFLNSEVALDAGRFWMRLIEEAPGMSDRGFFGCENRALGGGRTRRPMRVLNSRIAPWFPSFNFSGYQ